MLTFAKQCMWVHYARDYSVNIVSSRGTTQSRNFFSNETSCALFPRDGFISPCNRMRNEFLERKNVSPQSVVIVMINQTWSINVCRQPRLLELFYGNGNERKVQQWKNFKPKKPNYYSLIGNLKIYFISTYWYTESTLLSTLEDGKKETNINNQTRFSYKIESPSSSGACSVRHKRQQR